VGERGEIFGCSIKLQRQIHPIYLTFTEFFFTFFFVFSRNRLTIQHKLYFAFLKHLWLTDRRHDALQRLNRLCDVVDMVANCESQCDNSLRSACWLELGEWKLEGTSAPNTHIPETLQVEVLSEFKRATMMDGNYKSWHNWALLNFRIAQQMNGAEEGSAGRRRGVAVVPPSQRNHVVAAIKSFVTAISLGTKRWSASVQQDMLNFLACLCHKSMH
jgi:serine/threonine-protein kinase mTOR